MSSGRSGRAVAKARPLGNMSLGCTPCTRWRCSRPDMSRSRTQCNQTCQLWVRFCRVCSGGVATSPVRTSALASSSCTPPRSSGWCCLQTCPLGMTLAPAPQLGSTLQLCTVCSLSPPAYLETCHQGTDCTHPDQARQHSCPRCKLSSVPRHRHRRSQSRTQSTQVCHQRPTRWHTSLACSSQRAARWHRLDRSYPADIGCKLSRQPRSGTIPTGKPRIDPSEQPAQSYPDCTLWAR